MLDEQTIIAIKEMKWLYDCGCDIEFLALTYPIEKENIKALCHAIDENVNLKNYLENLEIEEDKYTGKSKISRNKR